MPLRIDDWVSSRRAARRLGFRYEGTFYRHMIVKGKNRDTAWYALLREDWQTVGAAFDEWLSPGNFDDTGQQKKRLADLIEEWRNGTARDL